MLPFLQTQLNPAPLAAAVLAMAFLCHGIFAASLVFPPYTHSYGLRKATPKHLFMFFGPATSFSDPQGLATVKMKSRDDTTTVKDDDEVVVYGVNSGRNELIYNTSMWGLALYGEKGGGIDQFSSPRGVACDADGHVFVADWGNNRIVHLFNPKKRVHWVSAFSGAQQNGVGLSGPEQVALDESGRVYVSDPGNRRIAVFNYGGGLLRSIAPAGPFSFVNGPVTLAVADGKNRYSHFRDERCIFCCDSGGKRLWKFDLDGNVLGRAGIPEGYAACYGATDFYHNFWVTDRERCCILKFDRNLAVLDTFGSKGDGDNQFIEPRGIAIYKRFGQTFVAEKNGAQYYWIGTDLKKASLLDKTGGRYSLSMQVTDYTIATLFSAMRKDTAFYFKRRWVPAGSSIFDFSLDGEKRVREPGLTLKIEPTYSSASFYAWQYPMKLNK
ncbi:MAG TPA: NHL repeat-containing protein [Chitinivibrionales bacterium]|nr:NHL repeat-containing protein [Chitinivibrionales bacterium]